MRQFDRRHFLGIAALGGGAMLTLPSVASASPLLQIHPALLERAKAALDQHAAHVRSRDVMGIVDFSFASAAPRFFLLNLMTGDVKNVLVAHGRGSDPGHTGWVQHFSNLPGSNASSNGSYLTGDTYIGQHGLSRRLIGLDAANDQAENRAIVIHAAWYVTVGAAQTFGLIGRSEGCFAVSPSDIALVLDRLGPGRLLYADKA